MRSAASQGREANDRLVISDENGNLFPDWRGSTRPEAVDYLRYESCIGGGAELLGIVMDHEVGAPKVPPADRFQPLRLGIDEAVAVGQGHWQIMVNDGRHRREVEHEADVVQILDL